MTRRLRAIAGLRFRRCDWPFRALELVRPDSCPLTLDFHSED
ncbi:hypothetical protein [Kitasatospora aureofaciens]